MRPNKILFIIINLFVFIKYNFSQTTSIQTFEKNSPAIWCDSVSVVYGLNPSIIYEFLKIYEQDGLSFATRKKLIENLIIEYNNLSPEYISNNSLNEEGKKKLGILDDDKISNVVDWLVFTKGANSPAIFSYGNAEVWYGIPKEAFISIYSKLEQDILDFSQLKNDLDKKVQEYNILQATLSHYPPDDSIRISANQLMKIGEFDKAEFLLESDYKIAKIKLSYKAYEVSKIKQFNFKYSEAEVYIKDAIKLDSTNKDFFLQYADIIFLLGRYNESVVCYEKYYKDYLDTLTADPFFMSDIYESIGYAHESIGEYVEALLWYQKACHKYISTGNTISYQFAIATFKLGNIYKFIGNYEQAIYYITISMYLVNMVDVKLSLLTWFIYDTMGEIYMYKGDFEKAKEFLDMSLRSSSNVYGPNHPNTAVSCTTNGRLYQQLGDFDSAMICYDAAYRIDTLVYGQIHPEVATAISNIASLYQDLGKYDTAIYLYRKALNIDLPQLGENNRMVADHYFKIGDLYNSISNCDSALYYCQKALLIDSILVNYNNYTIDHLRSYATALICLGDFKSAHNYLNDAIGILNQIYGDTACVEKVLVYNTIGDLYLNENKYTEAIANYSIALNADTILYKSINANTSLCYYNLAKAYKDSIDISLAYCYIKKAFNIYNQLFPVPRQETSYHLELYAEIANTYGVEMANMGDIDSALILYTESFSFASKIFDTAQLIRSAYNIGLYYYLVKKCDSALEYFTYTLNISKKVLSTNMKNSKYSILQNIPDSVDEKLISQLLDFEYAAGYYELRVNSVLYKQAEMLKCLRRKHDFENTINEMRDFAEKDNNALYLEEINSLANSY